MQIISFQNIYPYTQCVLFAYFCSQSYYYLDLTGVEWNIKLYLEVPFSYLCYKYKGTTAMINIILIFGLLFSNIVDDTWELIKEVSSDWYN